MKTRLAALAGAIAPSTFVASWAINGARTPGYSPVKDAISNLAREGASTRVAMTSAFVGFGFLMPLYARVLGEALETPALRASCTFAGLTTLGVAAFPLSDNSTQDTLHAVAAGSGYAAMALSPVFGGRALARMGHPHAAVTSYAVSAVSAACLVGIVIPAVSEGRGGLLQRVGLTVVDTWFVVLALRLLRRKSL